jgi:uncharacterized protein DUF4402
MRVGRGLALLVALLMAPAVHPQTTGSLQAGVTIVRALAVTGNSDLTFGTIASTSSKTVAPAGGGAFRIRGEPGQGITITFSLPADLGLPAAVLGSWTGLVDTRNRVATASAFSPTAPLSRTLNASNGRLFLWLGATLTTTAAPPGNYSVPVTLTVVYN